MRKVDEISDPKSCLNKAAPNEMLFVLLGRDVAAVSTVRFWIAERIRLGKNQPDDPKILEAKQWCDTVLETQRKEVTPKASTTHCRTD